MGPSRYILRRSTSEAKQTTSPVSVPVSSPFSSPTSSPTPSFTFTTPPFKKRRVDHLEELISNDVNRYDKHQSFHWGDYDLNGRICGVAPAVHLRQGDGSGIKYMDCFY